MPIVGRILSADEFKAQFTVTTKGVRDSAYVDLRAELSKLEVGEVYTASSDDISAGLGRAVPKHFKANMRKRLIEWFGKGTMEMVEAAYVGETKKPTYAFMKLA